MCSWFVDINDGVSKDCFRVCPAFGVSRACQYSEGITISV